MLGTRADVIVITKDRSIVYEIKTRSDSHQRIKSQIKDYSEVFDEIILVTEEEYSFRYHKHVPSYIGLMSMTSKGHIQILMPPQKQTDRLKSHAMLHQMRKAEKVEFVKRLDPEKKFVPTYSMKYSQEIAKDMTVEEMQTHIRYLNLLSQLPECMTAAMYDYHILKSEWKSIIEMLGVSKHEASMMVLG